MSLPGQCRGVSGTAVRQGSEARLSLYRVLSNAFAVSVGVGGLLLARGRREFTDQGAPGASLAP